MASSKSPSSLFASTLQLSSEKATGRAAHDSCDRGCVPNARYRSYPVTARIVTEFAAMRSAADTIFVVFGGRIYAEQPTWLTVSDYLWARFRRELGLKAEATPVRCRHSERRAVRLNDCPGTNLDKRSI